MYQRPFSSSLLLGLRSNLPRAATCVLQARTLVEDVPAILFLDDWNAAQGARGIVPAEGEIDLLPVVQGAHLHQRFARSVEIGTLLRADEDGARARPGGIAHGAVQLG